MSTMVSAISMPVYPFSNNGLSFESREITQSLQDYIESEEETLSLGWRTELINEMARLFLKYDKEGWDGYDALPMDIHSVETAVRFLYLMPQYISCPMIIPEPTGMIALEWKYKQSILSITTEANHLVYAFIDGINKHHGEIMFFDEMPQEILKFLSRFVE